MSKSTLQHNQATDDFKPEGYHSPFYSCCRHEFGEASAQSLLTNIIQDAILKQGSLAQLDTSPQPLNISIYIYSVQVETRYGIWMLAFRPPLRLRMDPQLVNLMASTPE